MVSSDKKEAGILSPTVKVLEWDKGGRGDGGIWTDRGNLSLGNGMIHN